ncbi:hypothetical protein P689_11984 [Candidatus Riesia pediculischaeffi PTSU]|uniref:Uncharacterized protein n=1 Tax=Candidatus Riesia pediculischaeffi PTSU TaxID=1401651 RepID=A0A0C1V8D0_9ENTR|nr:hypothetical protein P689_11984 [Candidatus Riesia pediculischaeffi PTSU]
MVLRKDIPSARIGRSIQREKIMTRKLITLFDIIWKGFIFQCRKFLHEIYECDFSL